MGRPVLAYRLFGSRASQSAMSGLGRAARSLRAENLYWDGHGKGDGRRSKWQEATSMVYTLHSRPLDLCV